MTEKRPQSVRKWTEGKVIWKQDLHCRVTVNQPPNVLTRPGCPLRLRRRNTLGHMRWSSPATERWPDQLVECEKYRGMWSNSWSGEIPAMAPSPRAQGSGSLYCPDSKTDGRWRESCPLFPTCQWSWACRPLSTLLEEKQEPTKELEMCTGLTIKMKQKQSFWQDGWASWAAKPRDFRLSIIHCRAFDDWTTWWDRARPVSIPKN